MAPSRPAALPLGRGAEGPVFPRVLKVKMPKKRGPDRKPTLRKQSTAEALSPPPANLLGFWLSYTLSGINSENSLACS